MKIKRLMIAFAIAFTLISFCSCSRNSNRAVDNAVRRGENAIDRGMGFMGNGIDNSMDVVTGNRYSANSGYSGNVNNGTGTTIPYSGRATELSPTLRSKARTNPSGINSNRGNADYGTK